MTSGCTINRWNGAWGEVNYSSPTICARDYQVMFQLPPGVEYVGGGTIPGTVTHLDPPTVTGDIATGIVLSWDARKWQTPVTGNVTTL